MNSNLPPNLPRLKAGWSWVKLGDVIKVSSGKGLTSEKMFGAGKYPVYGGNGITGYYDEFLFEDSRLIIGRVGAKCGVLHITKPKSWITDNALIVDLDQNNVFIKYLFYCLTFFNLNKLSVSTAQPVISGSKIYPFHIPLPPLPEQKKIVEKIEELFSGLDSGVASLKKAKEQLRLYRQSVLAFAFSGRLNQDSSDYKISRIKTKNKSSKSINTEKPNPAIQNPGNPLIPVNPGSDNLPDGWKWVSVADIGETITGTTPPKKNSEYYSNDYPLYKPTDLNAGINTRYASDNISELGATKARLLPIKSVMVTCIGATIGKTGMNKRVGATNQQINSIVLNKNCVPEFVYYFCISDFFQKQIKEHSSSTTLPILNKSKFESLPFIEAPMDQQHQIVSEIEKRFSETDNLEKAIDDSLEKSEALRQSILKQAFEGRLV